MPCTRRHKGHAGKEGTDGLEAQSLAARSNKPELTTTNSLVHYAHADANVRLRKTAEHRQVYAGQR